MLKAAGAVYVIVDGGTTHASPETFWVIRSGEALSESEVKPVVAKRSSPKHPRKTWVGTGYLEKMLQMAPGDTWTHVAETSKDATGLQKAVSGRAGQLWGKGNYMTVATGTKLELLRLA
jgi:hypothetical protein